MSLPGLRAVLCAALLGPGAVAHAQLPDAGPEMFAGIEARGLRFDRLAGVTRLSQTVIAFGGVLPIGRFTLDAGGAWVDSRMVRADGTRHHVDALTDTQVRASYVFGRDAVVATVLFNLPTGLERASPRDYTVIGAVSPSLLGFPVATYASGFSVTSGQGKASALIPRPDGHPTWFVHASAAIRIGSRTDPSHCVPRRYVGAGGTRDWPHLFGPGEHQDQRCPRRASAPVISPAEPPELSSASKSS